MQWSDSICGRDADSFIRLATQASETPGRLTVGLVKIPCAAGNNGHRTSCKAGPEDESDGPEAMAQWCFPSRRQHAGRLDCSLDAINAGLISAKLKRAISRVADARRMRNIIPLSRKICKYGNQNSSRAWNAIICGELSPPSPTPRRPVGGETV